MLDVTSTATRGAALSIPQVIERQEESFLAYRVKGAMRDLPNFAPGNFELLERWMKRKGLPAGKAPFFRYIRFGGDGEVELEVGYTTCHAHSGGDGVSGGKFPAGRYASATFTGPYDRLYDAFAMLNGWMDERGLRPDTRRDGTGRSPACHLEIYRVGPAQESDPVRWETDLLIRLAD